ncbi:heterokaryon incompatibility protein-domain-containing protein [Clohesyomyces aquaticus]|uniref:Heterokaryon incompatibility protein-domain-containing protein n=1 Tax=Clohesyomyces aquaticus TaxID=1231657 RepID=A0A1Y1ZLM1_9PLEO|nr:heterokaryon incompatibility protein-domain-containing protein [Clohesyomyces aquaticus]
MNPMNQESTYSYRPLRSPRSIRLVNILGIEEENIFCEVVEQDIDSGPPYVALSYVWGDPTIKHTIAVSGQSLGITESLHSALKDINGFLETHKDTPVATRDVFSAHEQLIWVDQICINQKDDVEKNVQVPLMTEIYSRAAFVASYIGAETDDTLLGVALLQILIEFYNKNKAILDGQSVFLHDYRLEELGLPSSEDPCWNALRSILHRPWSSRTWIVQEFVVNPINYIICGRTRLMKWEILFHLVMLASKRSLPTECILDSGEQDVSLLIEQERANGRIHALSQLRRFYRTEEGLNKSLCQLLRICHSHQSANPKDKIYACLNLARDRETLAIQEDYSPSTTVEDVYIKTATKILSHSQDLDLLSSNSPQKRLTLPSWVPDWTQYETGQGALLHHTALLRQRLYCASADLPSQVWFDEHSTILFTRGVVIDRLALMIATPTENLRSNSVPSAQEILYLQIVLESAMNNADNKVYKDAAKMKEAIWRTLIANVTHENQEATSVYEQHFDAFMAQSEQRSAGSAADTEPVNLVTLRMAHQFEQAMGSRSSGRDIGVTENGYMCLVPNGVQLYDVVTILRGGRVPFILRAEESGGYKLLGDAYVHGLMKGEALEFSDLSEEICLV